MLPPTPRFLLVTPFTSLPPTPVASRPIIVCHLLISSIFLPRTPDTSLGRENTGRHRPEDIALESERKREKLREGETETEGETEGGKN